MPVGRGNGRTHRLQRCTADDLRQVQGGRPLQDQQRGAADGEA